MIYLFQLCTAIHLKKINMIYSTILPVIQPYSVERLAAMNTEREKTWEKGGKRACTLQIFILVEVCYYYYENVT
jgi:hypothetical protein